MSEEDLQVKVRVIAGQLALSADLQDRIRTLDDETETRTDIIAEYLLPLLQTYPVYGDLDTATQDHLKELGSLAVSKWLGRPYAGGGAGRTIPEVFEEDLQFKLRVIAGQLALSADLQDRIRTLDEETETSLPSTCCPCCRPTQCTATWTQRRKTISRS